METPQQIVAELDKFIVGQTNAKRAVAVALRNRWRRRQLEAKMAEEVLPKNILMIGPTGCGKTEIARRVAKFADAPFIKVEATKFTEVGYVGKDTEQIIRDLVEVALKNFKEQVVQKNAETLKQKVNKRLIEALVGSEGPAAFAQMEKMLTQGNLETKEIEIMIQDQIQMPVIDAPGLQGAQMGMLNLNDMFGKMLGKNKKKRLMSVQNARKLIEQEERDNLMDEDQTNRTAIDTAEQSGIVFIDEIDKICSRQEGGSRGEISREGVQTRYGAIKTDHILFIASGAFHNARPSELMPELQGRLPVRVELSPLTAKDFERILTEPKYNLINQYKALFSTEGFKVEFDKKAIQTLAVRAFTLNEEVENIGARRLHTVLEKVLEELSFNASQKAAKKSFTITESYVNKRVDELIGSDQLTRLIL